MITVSASSVRIYSAFPRRPIVYPEDYRFVLLVLGLGAVVGRWPSWVSATALSSPRSVRFAMFSCSLPGRWPVAGPRGPKRTAGGGELGDSWKVWRQYILDGIAPGGLSIAIILARGGLCPGSAISPCTAVYRIWPCSANAKSVRCGRRRRSACFRPLHRLDLRRHPGRSHRLDVEYNEWTTWMRAALLDMPLGVAGAITVILAGWTTSNPTLYSRRIGRFQR